MCVYTSIKGINKWPQPPTLEPLPPHFTSQPGFASSASHYYTLAAGKNRSKKSGPFWQGWLWGWESQGFS